MRTLKSIANNKDLGLTIQALEIVRHDDRQLEILYKHDILYDEGVPKQAKNEDSRIAYYKMFKEAKTPAFQFIVSGPYAIAKM